MNDNLLKSLSNYITPDLITQASDTLGESETGIFNAISSTLPTLLVGLLNHANDPATIERILSLANHEDFDATEVLTTLPLQTSNDRNLVVLETGKSMLNLIYGNKQSGLFDILAQVSNVKKTSISRLILMLSPMTLAYIDKSELDTNSLIKTLTDEKDEIEKTAPVGLNAFLKQEKSIEAKVKAKVKSPKKKVVQEPVQRWILPFLILVVAFLLYCLLNI